MAQRERIVAINIARPYGEADFVREIVDNKVPKTLSRAERYVKREVARAVLTGEDRVHGIEHLISRARIENKRVE